MRPVLFTLFGYPVHSYGVMLIVAFLFGMVLVNARGKRAHLNVSQLADGLLFSLVIGVLGARLVFIAQDLPFYLAHPKQLLSPQFAGLTSFGGILFGVIALVLWSRRKRIGPLLVLDVIAPAFLLGHAIGRIGCLLNGCCYGGVCDPQLPWKITVAGDHFWHHPAQIYDSLLNLAAIPILLFLERKNRRIGQTFALMLVLHGLTRFIYEFWRGGTDEQVAKGLATSTYWIGWLTQGQAAAMGLSVAGIVMYLLLDKHAHAQQELFVSGAEAPPVAAVT